MKEYTTYIFDLDGTLLNTLGDLAASCNFALRSQGMPERSIEEVRHFVGNGVRKLIERAVPEGTTAGDVNATLDIFRQHYMEHGLDSTAPYQGVHEMLSVLSSRGKNIAVVSNKFYDATRHLCRHFFSDTVTVSIGEREGIRKKPAADTVIEALRELGVTADDAVYIGDSEVDVMTAKNSGMPCISVLWGFRDRDFLESNGAEIFAESPSDIVAF